jgi:hypothetical protein
MPHVSPDAAATGALFSWPLAWMRSFADFLVLMQQAQLDIVLTWQQSLAAIQQEVWDEWVSRWAGGVPLDA